MASRTILVSVLTATLLGVGIGGAAAGQIAPSVGGKAADTGTDAAEQLNAANFQLQASSSSPVITQLDKALPPVSVSTVVKDGNRTAATCSAPASNRLTSFCWKSTDNTVDYWVPQAITTTGDAASNGTYDGATAIAVAWYDNGTYLRDRGVRVSFIDYSNPSAISYRHVLLVEPTTDTNGRASFGKVDQHAGGMFWYGDYLYLAATDGGFRVFDMRHIYKTSTTNDAAIGVQPDGSYQAYGYQYVLPQVFRYNRSVTGGYRELTYSFASLDRTTTPPSIVVGEYANPGTGTRLVRFPTDEASHMLTASSDGFVHGVQAYDVSVTSMQGAASLNGKYYLSTSDGKSNKGDLATFVPGGSVTMHTDTLPIGTEDMSYWKSKNQLWSLAEYAGKRYIYAVRASAY